MQLEDKLQTVDPSLIKVSDTRPRQRRELGEIAKMVESIRQYGQIQPVVINREWELIAGGRRLAACLMGGFQVVVCFSDEVDPMKLRELELEENVQRKALTPAEESMAVSELVKLKQAIYGVPTSGREGGFTLDDAAELVGKTRGYIIDALNVAEAVTLFPDLSKCATKAEIKKAFKGYERIQQQVNALSTYEEKISRTDKFVLVNREAERWLEGLGDGSIDLVFTDPPYGVNIHDIAMTSGGETGGDITTTGTTYDDSEGYAKTLLEKLCVESYRVTKENGFAMFFCAPSHFSWLSERMAAAGWLVAPRPVVWIKRESGQNNQPEKWFSSAYEFILFARKSSSCLILQGRPDWLQVDPVLPSERVHQAEKPIALCKELISRVCMPGSYIADPCMGSGALVAAAVELKMFALGCEKDLNSYASAVSRMEKIV
jgi:ParB/RepB/Spo0J family partition protein